MTSHTREGKGLTDSHAEKADALADKIMKKAEDALSGLEREMTIMKWPPDFREIMWGTVAAVAAERRDDAGRLALSQSLDAGEEG